MIFWVISILMSFLGGKVEWKENSRLKFEACWVQGATCDVLSPLGVVVLHVCCNKPAPCSSSAASAAAVGWGGTGPSLSQQGFREWIRTIACCWRGQVTTCDVTWPTIVFNKKYIYIYKSLLQLMLWCFWCFDAERRRETSFTCNMSG